MIPFHFFHTQLNKDGEKHVIIFRGEIEQNKPLTKWTDIVSLVDELKVLSRITLIGTLLISTPSTNNLHWIVYIGGS